jgi:hypothetical protein
MPEITFDRRAGRYRDEQGRFLAQTAIYGLLEEERQRLQVRLQGLTRVLIQGQVVLGEWQVQIATVLRDAHLRMATLAAGGKDLMTQPIFGAIGFQLRRQYEYLQGFAVAIAEGRVTQEQALRRIAQYADSIKLSFHRAEQLARGADGFTEAKRVLDSRAQHCISCLSYSTKGKWTLAETVVLPGVGCECGGFCKCQIYFRRKPARRSPLSRSGGLL